jgi:hypothetical protein
MSSNLSDQLSLLLVGRGNSSSESEKETIGQSFRRLDLKAAISLKKGTFASPLMVLTTQASPEAAKSLISATICWKSV